MHESYSITGKIVNKGIEYSIEGKLTFNRKGELVRKHDGDSRVSILPGKYYLAANVYGGAQQANEKLALVLRFPQEFKIGDYISLNGSSIEDLSGDYVGSWQSLTGREYDTYKASFNPKTDTHSTIIKLEKIIDP